MTVKVSRDQLIAMNPCGGEDRLKLFGRRKTLTARQALEAGASIADLLWVAGRLGLKRECVQFALQCAQAVAHFNPDPRIQAALDATRAWLEVDSEETRAAARAAAEGARAAAEEARAAAEEAARAGWAGWVAEGAEGAGWAEGARWAAARWAAARWAAARWAAEGAARAEVVARAAAAAAAEAARTEVVARAAAAQKEIFLAIFDA